MKRIHSLLFLLIFTIGAIAQPLGKTLEIQSEDIIITPYPFGIDDEITITIKSNNSCNDFGSEVIYLHSGVGTDANAWIYTKGNWGEDDGIGKMTNNNNGTHSITLTPKTYYSIPDDKESITSQMGMVFRNFDASKKWSYYEGSCTDADYFVGIGNFQISLISPDIPNEGVIIMNSGENLNIKVTSSEVSNFSIKENGTEIKIFSDVTEIDFNTIVTATSVFSVDVNNGSATKNISFTAVIPPTPIVESLPVGIKDGINYHTGDDTKVTLVLHAPNKDFVYVKGDFSDWKIINTNQLKVTHADATNPDTRYWITLGNLESGKEYAFQYVVDAEKIIADPYTEKVLDPWNDQHIPSDIYPNLKPYPEGKTEGIVSVFQTGQIEYNWKTTEYQKPAKENLIIYELLVRDFVATHSYQTIIDTLDYLERLNINAIELMPINEFEGNESWGYNPSFMFAPDKYYGTKDKLKELIDEAHSRGIAVIIDIVMNHSFGQSPFVQLYDWHNGDGQIIMDEDTPWFNRDSPNTDYHWGADFNHESIYTKALLDSVNHFWMKEYKVDGFRFDFTKGFTNTVGPGHGYDASRIAILKRMYDEIIEVDPNAYVILEHLADNSEEKILAEYGMMLWGNMVHNYGEAAMGWNQGNKSDLSWASYKNRGWTSPNLVSYSSSHDEERIAFKSSQWGNSTSTYDITELPVNMERMQLQAMFMYTIPGPKMIWQFDELGYDISIDDPCRVCNKPIKWEYTKDPSRSELYKLHKNIFNLKNTEPAFSTTNFILDVDNGARKSIVLEHSDMNVVLVGNFDVTTLEVTVEFPNTGTWYSYFDGNQININSNSQSIKLNPGEYKMFTTKKLNNPDLKPDENNTSLNVYPVPSLGDVTIKYSLSNKSNVEISIIDLLGKVVKSYNLEGQEQGTHLINWSFNSEVNSGLYFVRMVTSFKTVTQKIIVI